MSIFTDQLNRRIELTRSPQRIISLVPSQTELLYHLGLESEVTGITKFCVHPEEWFRNKTRIGGTKTVKADLIRALQPDLIIANKEENVQEQVEALALEYPVWISDIHDLPSSLDMIGRVAELTGRKEKGEAILQEIDAGFGKLDTTLKDKRDIKTAYLIWNDPVMTVGQDTFIHDILSRCGLQNVFSHLTRYPIITPEMLQRAGCELLLLSSEPFPFKQKHIDEWQQQLPDTKILLVDGEMFSWYGSRLLYAPEYLQDLLQELTGSRKGK